MKVSITVVGASAFQGRLKRAIARVHPGVREVNRRFGPIMLETLRRHASGRPGPEVQSGEFLGRMQVEITDGGLSVTGSNDSPQAARLEMGFVATDALGRHYNQPPYPWARPTLLEVGPRYQEAFSDEVPRWLQ